MDVEDMARTLDLRGSGVGAGAGAAAGGNFSRDRHINFAARFSNRMQFFLAGPPSAIAFQWQEANPGGKWRKGIEWDGGSGMGMAIAHILQPVS